MAALEKARILVTGAAGFIGSALCRQLVLAGHAVLALDALRVAASLPRLDACMRQQNFRFVQGDIADRALLAELLASFQPQWVANLAAETHVDRSLDSPDAFCESNLIGTYELLESLRAYQANGMPEGFRLLQVSTDEVFGAAEGESLQDVAATRYAPSSPYSATKAGADMLVQAWGKSYGLPYIISHCGNNFGPYQYPEKLVPLMIAAALRCAPLPLYGDGQQERDWLYVEDHARALIWLLQHGEAGSVHGISAGWVMRNTEMVAAICAGLDARLGAGSRANNIVHVSDRPAHDRRYALDGSAFKALSGWQPQQDFQTHLATTLDWYCANQDWLAANRVQQKADAQ